MINNQNDYLKAIKKYNIPKEIVEDVNYRIGCWLESGGNLNDNYIKQQYRYVDNYINLINKKH